MKFLVTGSSGLVGRQVVMDLVKMGFQVYSGYQKSKPEFGITKQFDITDFDKVTKVIESIKPDVIIHLAGMVGGIQDNISKPVDYIEQNLLINTNVIKAAYNSGITKSSLSNNNPPLSGL